MPRQVILFLFFSPLLFLATPARGQAVEGIENKTLAAYQQRNYTEALSNAESLLSADSQRVDALFIAGESAMNLGAFELAETYLQRIPAGAKTGLYAITDLRLAVVKNKQGKCREAKNYFEKYRKTVNLKADLFLLQIQRELEECSEETAIENTISSAEITRLGKNVNTSQSEIAPFRYADKLYYTSTFSPENKEQPVERIYTAVRNETSLPFQGNPKEKDVRAMHPALTTDAKRIYYSLCAGEDSKDAAKCSIWYRERTYEGDWGPLKKLPLHINLPGYSTAQPSVGFDNSLKKEVLFFASDRPGGKGKIDLWYSAIERDGSFGVPQNLPFNSPDDDVAPSFDNTTQSLFFSSNQSGGLGGFDIYLAEKAATGDWTPPRPMHAPLNSAFDELYFTFHNGTYLGYFSSNRPSENCPDPNASCKNFDIYQVKMFVNLDVTVFDAADTTALNGTTIELIDIATEKIDTTCLKIKTNQSNVRLALGKSYRLIVSKPGFFPVYTEISTSRMNFSSSLEERVYLKTMNTQSKSANREAGSNEKHLPDGS